MCSEGSAGALIVSDRSRPQPIVVAAAAAMFRNYRHDPADPTGRHGFEIHGLDISLFNALRRVILTDIPVMGFSGEEEPTVEIRENNGPLHNEIIGHRIGLLPIHFSEEETDSATADSWSFELAPPKNDTDRTINVTTHDFKVTKNGAELPEKEVRRLFPANAVSHAPILITRLRPGEKLALTATPVKRTARFHASFCPVSLCSYQFLEDPVLAAGAKDPVERERAYKRNEVGEPVGAAFQLETEVALGPKYLVSKALDILLEKVTSIPQELHAAAGAAAGVEPSADAKIVIAPSGTVGVEFAFRDEDDTLGNMLQSHIHQRYVRDKANAPNGDTVSYAGYFCPHPLDPTMILRVVLTADVISPSADTGAAPAAAGSPNISPYVDLLSESCRALQVQLQQIQNEWLRFAPA